MRRRVLGARVYGEGCVPTFLGEVRETEKVLFSRTGEAGRESRIRRGYVSRGKCAVGGRVDRVSEMAPKPLNQKLLASRPTVCVEWRGWCDRSRRQSLREVGPRSRGL